MAILNTLFANQGLLGGGTVAGDLTVEGDLAVEGDGTITIDAAASGNVSIVDTTTSSATQGGNLILASNDGAVMGDTHRLGVLSFAAAEDTSDTLTTGASIDAFADGAWDADSAGTFLKFSTTPTGNSVSLTERLRIDSAGKVGIGTDSP